jgi:hypothetical protein
MTSDAEKEALLWKMSFSLVGNSHQKQQLWEDATSGQFQQVAGRLITFELMEFARAEPDYPDELKKELKDLIAELIKDGFYIHCAEAVYITHEFESYLDIKPYDDLGLQEYLIREMQPVIDDKQIKDELESPTYVISTGKTLCKFWWTNILPDNKAFRTLSEENQGAFLSRVPGLIVWGYMLSALQKQYHDEYSDALTSGHDWSSWSDFNNDIDQLQKTKK